MAISVQTSRTIRGISYKQGQSFVCAADGVKGNGGSEGNAGAAAALTKGKTYYFLGYAVASDSGSTVKYPCRIGSTSNTSGAIGWYPESVFPYATYKIVCNANGGTGGKTLTKTYGTAVTLPSGLTRSGYTFMGWGTSATDTSVDYAGGAKYTANAAKTLYAIWKKTITLTYNANGGSGAPSAQSASVYNATTSKAFTLSSTKPTKSGYTFLGWSKSSTATSASYSAGGSITLSSSDTLYAIWRKTIKVTYNANGGSGAPSEQSANVYNNTASCKFTLSSTVPKKTNYNFLGWSTSKTATSASYASGSSQTFSSNTTLYAVWELAYIPPRIDNLTVNRYSVNDDNVYVEDETGTIALVNFSYECDAGRSINQISIECTPTSGDGDTIKQNVTDFTNTSVSEYIANISADKAYVVTVTVTDDIGYSVKHITLPGSRFAIDVMPENAGIAFGGPAELENTADFKTYAIKPTSGYINILLPDNADLNEYRTPNTYIGDNVTSHIYTCGGEELPFSSGSFVLDVLHAGSAGQTRQRIQVCDKSVSSTYERWYYSSEWGSWYEVGDYKSYMTTTLYSTFKVSAASTYTQIPMTSDYASRGTGLGISNGLIVVGKGVRRVRVSGTLMVLSGSTSGLRHARLVRDRNGSLTYIGWQQLNFSNSSSNVFNFTPITVAGNEGDQFYFVYYTPDTTDSVLAYSSNGNRSYLTVESV